MDALEITDTQERRSVSAVPTTNAQAASPRRLKKREIDRRFQREARDRRRSRIASLERLVIDLRQQDASGQVAVLLAQLKSVQEERDVATKTLKDIQHLMVQRTSRPNEDRAQDNGTAEFQTIGQGAKFGCDGTKSPPSLQYPPVLRNTRPALVNIEATPANDFQAPSFINMAPECQHSSHPYPARSSAAKAREKSSTLTDQALEQASNTGKQPSTGLVDIYDWVNPQTSCACHSHVDRRPGQLAVWQGNFWKFVCDVLSERFDWAEDVQPADDIESEDVLICAMVEGWDAAATHAPLHPSLDMLRRIDQATFQPIGKTERLAMLRAMHLLIQYHTQPCTERYKRLPSWYLYRPGHHIPHTYAIDYWAWPLFRHRFITDQDVYCGNDFWYVYQSQLRLLWPFEFRDCYTHDLETDRYKTSSLFDERINDIKCWTMEYDFFQRFPELSSAIPVAIGQVPRLLRRGRRQMGMRSFSSFSRAPKGDLQPTRVVEVDVEEPQQQPQQVGQEQEQEQQPADGTDPLGAASTQAFPATYGGHLQPDLTQFHDQHAYTLPSRFDGYDVQLPDWDSSFVSPQGGHNLRWFDFDASIMEHRGIYVPPTFMTGSMRTL